MEIEEALIARLLAQSGLTALIGRRLFPEEIPQNTIMPAVSMIKISDVKDHALTGQLQNESPIFQFTSFAETKASARAVTNQIKTALVDYSGDLSGIQVEHIKLLTEVSNLETSADGLIRVHTEDLEFEINFIRS